MVGRRGERTTAGLAICGVAGGGQRLKSSVEVYPNVQAKIQVLNPSKEWSSKSLPRSL